jgi:hypothetical protein
LPPELEQSPKASCEQGSECLGRDSPAKRRALAVCKLGSRGEIDPEADDDAIAAALEENSCELLPEEEDVVGPLEHQSLSRNGEIESLDQRETRRKGQGLGWRVAGPEVDKRASVEIACRRDPFAALAPPPRLLLEGNQPVAFTGALVGNEVRIGRAGALDDSNSAQNSDPAA